MPHFSRTYSNSASVEFSKVRLRQLKAFQSRIFKDMWIPPIPANSKGPSKIVKREFLQEYFKDPIKLYKLAILEIFNFKVS